MKLCANMNILFHEWLKIGRTTIPAFCRDLGAMRQKSHTGSEPTPYEIVR